MKGFQSILIALLLAGGSAFAQSNGDPTVTVQPPGATQINPVIPVAPGDVKPGIAVPTDVVPPVVVVAAQGETKVTLDVAFGIRYVPASRVTVPVGERLTITSPFASAASATSTQFTWTKNEKSIPGVTGPVLTIDFAQSSDAGRYVCLNSAGQPSQQLTLGVGPTTRLFNASTRGTLGAGAGQNFTTGFVVGGGGVTAKKMIVRAIGPTLARFGVEKPLAKPVLRIFDGAGKPYETSLVYPAVVGGDYWADLANSLAAAGAFPTPPNSDDVVILTVFLPGSYTAQVTSADGSGGEVLIEIYEVP